MTVFPRKEPWNYSIRSRRSFWRRSSNERRSWRENDSLLPNLQNETSTPSLFTGLMNKDVVLHVLAYLLHTLLQTCQFLIMFKASCLYLYEYCFEFEWQMQPFSQARALAAHDTAYFDHINTIRSEHISASYLSLLIYCIDLLSSFVCFHLFCDLLQSQGHSDCTTTIDY